MNDREPHGPAPYHADPLKHPACVDRKALRPLKRSGFVRPRAFGARLMSRNAIYIVQAANAPHAYTSKNLNDIVVPAWVAVVFACHKGRVRESIVPVMRDVGQRDAEWRAAFVAVARLSGIDAAKQFYRESGYNRALT